MSGNLIGESLKEYFQTCSVNKNKIFVESTLDDNIATNIVSYFNAKNYDVERAKKCVDLYINTAKGAGVSLSDFVMKLSDIADAVEAVESDRENVRRLIENTRKRMEGY